MGNENSAAIYCRISRDQTGSEEGVARQEKLCRELAERSNLEVVHVYTDNDQGASDQTKNKIRPNYERMLEDAKSGKFDYILAYSTSRLTRRAVEFAGLVELNHEHDIRFKTVDVGEIDLASANGIFMAQTYANLAQLESNQIAERQRATYLDKAQNGKPKIHRQRAFGYENDGITLVPEEVELIREGLEKILQGHSITTICREWESRGIRTASGNTKWEWQTMKNVLLGWKTAGVSTYKRKPLLNNDGSYVTGQWKPIITLEERENALNLLKKRSIKKERQGKWLLTGLVHCGECFGKMYGQLTGTPTYACKPGNGHVAITAEHLEELVVNEVAAHILERTMKALDNNEADKPAEPETWPKEEELENITIKQNEIMAAYKADNLPQEIAFSQVNELGQTKNELIKERDEFYAAHARPKQQFADDEEIINWILDSENNIVLKNANHAKVQQTIRNELDYVIVNKGERGRGGWGLENLLERLEYTWRT